jgi:GNAT superfamily N-acetyltransferase
MYKSLGNVTLKTGETVVAGVIIGPEPAWSERLVGLLYHKGEPWNWQNARVLERALGLDVFFYILQRDGVPFSNIMTIELAGVGLFGHVWTKPEDRQKGASSRLMQLQMEHFVGRGGQALFLGTGPDSVAYRMYAGFGFQPIEPHSGYMAYYQHDQAAFEAAYFADAPLIVEALAWPHWPASVALFLGDFPGLVRCAPLQLIGRQSSEGALLPALLEAEQRQAEQAPPTTIVLRNQATGAVMGLATWRWDAIWPETCLVDLYCHPQAWSHAAALLAALELPAAESYLAYADAGCPAKVQVLNAAGFRQTTQLPRRIRATGTAGVDVLVFEK